MRMTIDYFLNFIEENPIQALLFASAVGCLLGGFLGFVFYRVWTNGLRLRAELEAQDILQTVKDAVELQALDEKEKSQDIENELWAKVEQDIQAKEEKLAADEERTTETKTKLDQAWGQEKQKALEKLRTWEAREQELEKRRQKVQQLKARENEIKKSFCEKMASRIGTSVHEQVEILKQKLLVLSEDRAQKYLSEHEISTKEHSEDIAKNLISSALSRFQRPYCAERGISAVYFTSPEEKTLFSSSIRDFIESFTGCEISIEEDMDFIGVAGFDPVRRELARRVLERCLREKKNLRLELVQKFSENIKKELLNSIKRDGDLIAKELRLDGIHPEIRQMMGSLRYRYSFTQNQYFHCGEVGWLCGLLAAELGGVSVYKSRRSGLLHDLGKSMDHEVEGGHAVIGADFIEKRGESPDIIHAVRAHHFDVQPAAPMDFLVIGADAISGARPGARRSTVESYNQKVNELDSIARSFDGVTDCFVLNGGRECRVLVNSKRVNDWEALDMGKKISLRIENELNYPGQIKVVIVRETIASVTSR